MARRKKSTPIEDLIELFSMLPWWAGVAVAVVSYVVLGSVAAQPVATAAQPGQVGAMVTQTIWRAFAGVGQYALPLICLVGAGASAWGRRERQVLIANVMHSKAADALDGMSWQQFERLVGEALRLQGYAVVETGGGGPDGGVDLVLRRGGEKFLVQCKQWRAFKVGVDVVRELYGVMAATGAAGGFVVTSGRFTGEALAFADGRNVTLVDGAKLHGWIQQARASDNPLTDRPASPRRMPPSSATPVTKCPLCARPMLKRTARRGTNEGGEFWGCSAYPGCKGTRALR